jgi:NADPH:quinone reductase-like Zn-dependent oxidoreductase
MPARPRGRHGADATIGPRIRKRRSRPTRVLERGKMAFAFIGGAAYLMSIEREPMSRSVRFHEFGGPEVLKIEAVVVPPPSPKEVRLQIKAIGLNRSEVLSRSGKAATKITLPAQLGLEAAGLIDALGPDVDGLAVGDRVAVVPGKIGRGYYSELALAPARTIGKIPDNQSWQDAAATLMAFATARTGLIDIASPSKRVGRC